jgi:cell division protease FtsH
MGGRVAEQIVFGDLSTGANNDLVGNTELARKMVREWGMSERIGPMAWGSQGMVFLGEDLMHTRDYSDETSRVIDEEVETILRVQEERATKLLSKHRGGLEAVADALLEQETIDGAEVKRLVDEAYGSVVKNGTGGAWVNGRVPRSGRGGAQKAPAAKKGRAPSRARPTSQ